MPHTPDDELLSAMLDGEAVESDVAHVNDCVECQARLAVLRGVALAVATKRTLPSAQVREAAVAVAMKSTVDGQVSRMPVRRLNTLSAAAVLAVALAIGGLAISQIGKGREADSNTTTAAASDLAQSQRNTKAAPAPAAGTASAAGGVGTEGAADSVAAAKNPYDAGDAGRFRNMNDIVSLAQGDLAKPEAEQSAYSTHPATTTCALPADSTVLWEASLYYLDAPVSAVVRTGSSSRWILELRSRDASDCSVLASQEFAPTNQR